MIGMTGTSPAVTKEELPRILPLLHFDLRWRMRHVPIFRVSGRVKARIL